jgi:hypothetical protein
VDADALPARDVAGDGVGRRRPAAARERRQQRADADKLSAALAQVRRVAGVRSARRR